MDNNIQSLGIHTQIDNESTNENPIFVHSILNGQKKVSHLVISHMITLTYDNFETF